MNTLSFIIPVYNGEKYINRCLKSIFRQDYEYLELIIIDDGSTDNSKSIITQALESLNTKKIPVRYIEQDNQGVAATRNLGIRIATGDYIAFVDQDDYIEDNFCNIFMPHTQNNYDIIISGFCRKNIKGKTTYSFIPQNHAWTKYCLTYPWARIIKRSFLIDNNIDFLKTSIGEDVYFNIIAYSYTSNICLLPQSTYVWFYNPVSVSNINYTKINRRTNPIDTFNCIIKRLPQENHLERDYLEYYFIKFTVWYLLSNAKQSNSSELLDMRGQLFAWLDRYFPAYRKNKLIGVFSPKGDKAINKLAVSCYMFFHKINFDVNLLKLLTLLHPKH